MVRQKNSSRIRHLFFTSYTTFEYNSVFIGIGVTATLTTSQENLPASRAIESIARRTKAQGKTNVTIPGPIIDYPNMGISLDEALKKYSVVVVEVAESKGYIRGQEEIRTAYKFRVVEFLSPRAAEVCATCPPLTDVSSRLSAPQFNEFFLEVSGGTVTSEGVKVTMTESGKLRFSDGKKYLMLVSFTPGATAQLAAGPASVFLINEDDSIESIGSSKSLITTQIQSRFSNKLSSLRQSVRRL